VVVAVGEIFVLRKNKYNMKEKKKQIFSEKEIKSISEPGEILRNIHNRLISEGYILKKDT